MEYDDRYAASNTKRCQQRIQQNAAASFLFSDADPKYTSVRRQRIVCPAHPVSYGDNIPHSRSLIPNTPVSQHQNTALVRRWQWLWKFPQMLPDHRRCKRRRQRRIRCYLILFPDSSFRSVTTGFWAGFFLDEAQVKSRNTDVFRIRAQAWEIPTDIPRATATACCTRKNSPYTLHHKYL